MNTPKFQNFTDRLDLLAPLSPTIAGTIVKILQSIVEGFQRDRRGNGDDPSGVEISTSIPLRRVPKLPDANHIDGRYRYVSAIAHTLSGRYQSPPLRIATQLYSDAAKLPLDRAQPLVFQLSSDDRGYLYFDLTAVSIGRWLEYLHQDLALPDLAPAPYQPRAEGRWCLDIAIYARARCQSLLRLAQSQQCIDLDQDWHISTPSPLFSSRDILQAGQTPFLPPSVRLFEDSAEGSLIQSLMDVLDGIHRYQSIDAAKLAIDLAQAWLEFHRDCRMWGDVKQHHPDTAIARWGLTAIVGRYLHFLLTARLGVDTPLEF